MTEILTELWQILIFHQKSQFSWESSLYEHCAIRGNVTEFTVMYAFGALYLPSGILPPEILWYKKVVEIEIIRGYLHK
jgi:hypothetical protein